MDRENLDPKIEINLLVQNKGYIDKSVNIDEAIAYSKRNSVD